MKRRVQTNITEKTSLPITAQIASVDLSAIDEFALAVDELFVVP